MASLGKRTQERDTALTRIAELEAKLGSGQGDSDTQDGNSQDSGVELGEGETYEVVNGQLVKVEPPTPRGQNAARHTVYEQRNRDDGSPDAAWGRLATALGATDDTGTW
jgi:hypothetical protein